MKKAFATWTHKGTQYLAVPTDGGDVLIMDDEGDNYGRWLSISNFRDAQRGVAKMSAEALGIAHAAISPAQSEPLFLKV